MTFAMGRRFVIVDGAERFKDRDVEAHLVPALAGIAPDTTVAFFAREEGRAKASPKLAAAVKAAGGEVVVESAMKARELPRWLVGEAGRPRVTLDGAAAPAPLPAVGGRRPRPPRRPG